MCVWTVCGQCVELLIEGCNTHKLDSVLIEGCNTQKRRQSMMPPIEVSVRTLKTFGLREK